MDIVIIGHNEGKFIDNMIDSLKPYNYNKVWVLDRCSDESICLLDKHNEFYVETDWDLKGRQTSYSRNLGLSYTKGDVLFLDGDRYLKKGNLNILNESKYDIELLYLEDDFRDNRSQKDYGNVINGFYSCGIYLKRESINKIIDFQGELFNTEIQGVWGIEDTYLGDICYHLGLTCNYNSNIRLNGRFDRTELKNMHAIETRFKMRQKLDVLW